jgi:hypothetical protein
MNNIAEYERRRKDDLRTRGCKGRSARSGVRFEKEVDGLAYFTHRVSDPRTCDESISEEVLNQLDVCLARASPSHDSLNGMQQRDMRLKSLYDFSLKLVISVRSLDSRLFLTSLMLSIVEEA